MSFLCTRRAAACTFLLLLVVVSSGSSSIRSRSKETKRRLQFDDLGGLGDIFGDLGDLGDLGALFESISEIIDTIFGDEEEDEEEEEEEEEEEDEEEEEEEEDEEEEEEDEEEDEDGIFSDFTDAFQEIFCSIPLFPGCDELNAANATQCSLVRPLDATEFDLERYAAGSWYVQEQQVNPYQSEEQLYCITATYNIDDDGGVEVLNYGNQNNVNGETMGSGLYSLCAEQETGGQLAVAPCILPQPVFDLFAGDYWVIALDQENYEWAIVSAGEPNVIRETIENEDGTTTALCSTVVSESFLDTNGSGLWLFSRNQTAAPETITMMKGMLNDMGVYTGDLLPVQQEGCLYAGATLKSEPEVSK